MSANQALSKLKHHWTNIAHHLYLKADCPVPLPAVGPLAELLHVTTTVCQELNALAAAGKLTSEDISTALEANTVRLLGRLVQWLQAEPHEQLLLNSERGESLWQLLLLTLANMLKVLQPDQDVVVVDADLINSFKQQLQSSGVLGAGSSDGSSDGSSAQQPAAAEPAAGGGILSALQWLLQHYPHRCLTASMGAWLLLIELGATDSTLPQQHADADAGADAADAAAAAAGKDSAAAVLTVSPFAVSEGLTSGLATVLQAYVHCAYANVSQPPTAPLPQAAGGPASGRSSGATTPVRKMASREKVDSSSGSSPAVTTTPRKRGPAAAAAAAAPEDGSSPGGHAEEGKAAAVDAGAVLKGVVHAVCLVDDPSTPVFLHLLALLHSLQIQLLVLAARVSRGGEEQQDSGTASGGLQLPHATNRQVLAAANTWLQQQAGTAAVGGGQQYVHETLLPLPAVALAGLRETGMDSLAAVQQLVELCSKALQQDCIHFITAKRQQQRDEAEQPRQQAPGAAHSSGSGSTAGSSAGVGVDAAQVFKLLLDSVCLQQACGAAVTEESLNGVAVAARGCSRPEVQQLLQQRGTELLHVLLRYIQQDPRQQQQQQEQDADSSSAEAEEDAAAAAAAAEEDYYMPRRCVACAQVFMDVCSMGRRGVDEDLLGCLTEQDPATFYAIMDLLVRKVHPDSLTVLLPMSACFLQHDMSAILDLKEQQRQRKQQQQQQQPEGATAAAGSAEGTVSTQDEEQPSSSSSNSSSSDVQELIAASRSLVILHDPDVCRTFAAALHGYCKTALAHLDDLPAGGADVHGGCSGHSCGHEHHEHGHEHHHHHGHERSVSSTLPPLHQVVNWLLCSYDITMRAAGDDSATQELRAADAAAGGGSDGSSVDRVLASVNKQAKQLQAASQAAAGSLVLTILLVRAAAPVLDWMQKELQQLPPAAGSSSSSSSTAGDVLLPLGAAMDLYAGLAFVRNVWQAICSRYALSILLEEQLGKLLRVSSAGYAAWTAQSEKLSGKKAGAAAAAAAAADGSPGAAAVAEAERVAKGLQMAAAQTKAVLLGRGLARGWSHLAFMMPQEALIAARDFQTTWPGDLLQECKASSALEAAQDKLHAQQHAGNSSNGEQQHVVLQAHAHQELQRLTRDAQRMFAAFMDDIPLPVGCNNPGCTRIEAVAEATLSINKRCSQCLAAHYCCKECQRDHWPSHKTACKRLRLQVPAAVSKPA